MKFLCEKNNVACVEYGEIEFLSQAIGKRNKAIIGIKDKFILEAKARLISGSKIKKQQHARKYTSTFWVFKKDEKMAAKTKYLDIMNGDFYKPKRKKKSDE